MNSLNGLIEITDRLDALLSIIGARSQDLEEKHCINIAWDLNYDLRMKLFNFHKQPALTSEPAIARTMTWPTETGTTNQLTIGARIRQLRKERQLTQADIAEAVNVSTQAICLWENDNASMSVDKLIPLANALKCDPMWLLTGNPLDVKAASPATPAPVNVMKGADLANIGVRINSRRNEMGMSPLKLAEEIDTSGAMILEWETGKAIPHSGYYGKLAKALNTTVTWLITGKHITA
ncbi:hypothetical protein DLB52_22280 [Salmonella enterica subsp. salamae]|nr:helix-turn-helix domain-containing protein [Salmonella enterica subsp. salamae]ECC8833521.1 hypothetical protein [Salmonella enterica subsp. salamae]ECG0680157.1 hypothetical protein [Salmonella enterica subsp. salamae]